KDIFVQRTKKPGTKKVFYYMEKDIIRINLRKIRAAHERQVHGIKRFMPYLLEKYKNAKLSEEEKEMVKIGKDYYQQVLKFEKILEEFERYLEKQIEGYDG
ncbi:MAG: hypothetical protein V1703_02315, partial [Candidatus Altiarchaeota archaeon]